jgi:multidrug efflux pump subunit AcrB
VLNFGQPAPIDIRVSGPHSDAAYAVADKIANDLHRVPGVVDSHVFQVPNAPTLSVDVDRAMAQEVGLNQYQAASDVLVTTNNSAQTAPNFWVDPSNGVSYPLAVQLPTYKINTLNDIWQIPMSGETGTANRAQLLMNLSRISRATAPLALSQLNIRPVFDVDADVQGRDLASAASAIDKVLANDRPAAATAITVTLSGQVDTMDRSPHRADGGAFCADRRDLDAIRHPDAHERSGSHGHADVHRSDNRQ